MSRPEKTDLVIIGAGCAGLSLAHQLTKYNNSPSVVLLEPRREYTNDRRWSLWSNDEHDFSDIVRKKWHQWAYGFAGQSHKLQHANVYTYETIESLDFYNKIIQSVQNNLQIKLHLGESVDGISEARETWTVKTAQRSLQARYIVDTRPPSAAQMESSSLFQCFAGEILTQKGAFNPDTVELMTEMSADAHGFYFTYCLPFSSDHALLEATRFSGSIVTPEVLRADLLRIKHTRGWSDAKVIGTEHGLLPMGMTALRSDAPNYVYAGTASGALRAASGYGFSRIQAWARDCAIALCNGKAPIPHPPEPKLQAWMDRLFLNVLKSRPDQTPKLFQALYSRLSADELARFMSDKASLWDRLKVIRSLPALPFLLTMWRQ